MKKHWNRKGFSLAEVLIVIGILVVLMGVGFVAIISHMRNTHLLEMDGQAKEIFVAAQNHIVLAEGQGYIGLKSVTTEGGEAAPDPFGEVEDSDAGIYYFIVGGGSTANPNDETTALGLMLPFGSVDDTVRSGGSYIIRYQKSPAVILDVFYVSTSGRYSLAGGFQKSDYTALMGDSPDYRGDKDLRKNYNKAVVGYYGGVEASSLKQSNTPLKAPVLEVINAEKLLVKVTNLNDASSGDGVADTLKNSLTLILTSTLDRTKQAKVDLIRNGDIVYTQDADGRFTIVLDDVTDTSSAHFASAYSGVFVPGENILIKAVAYNNHVATNVAESGTDQVNSLFESLDFDNKTVTVSNIRHLLNLSNAISGVNFDKDEEHGDTIEIIKAEQSSDLSWTGFLQAIRSRNNDDEDAAVNVVPISGLSSSNNAFLPLVIDRSSKDAFTYDGAEHKISDVYVDASGNAGIFGSLNNCSVYNLELVDFNVKGTGSVGALVGSAVDSDFQGILVHNSQNAAKTLQIKSTGGAAGGLAGSVSSGSVIDKCAAAVYVSATGNAGGLVGSAVGGSVSDSYSGGHTKDGRYENMPEGYTTLAAVEDTYYDSIRINVLSDGYAGGLIGYADGTAVSYSYSTASALGSTPGGLIGGVANSAAVSHCYSVGKVFQNAGGNVYAFVGSGFSTGTFSGGGNYYLANVSDKAQDYGAGYETLVKRVTNGQTEETNFIIAVANRQNAEVYDKTLLVDYGGKYFFPTIAQLHGGTLTVGSGSDTVTLTETTFIGGFTLKHYGDWQIPGLTPLDYTFINQHTLYTDVKLDTDTLQVTVALYGENSTNARVFILDVDRDADKKPTAIRVAKEGVVLSGAAGGTITNWIYDNFTIGTKNAEDNKYYITLDTTGDGSFRLTFDDITTSTGHFTQLFNKGTAPLTPGENVTLLVGGGEGSWTELLTLKKTTFADYYNALTAEEQAAVTADERICNPYAKTENSLFGKTEAAEQTIKDSDEGTADAVTIKSFEGNNADILYYRHLQNLDQSVSDVSSYVTGATLKLFLDSDNNGVNDLTPGAEVKWVDLTEEYTQVYNYLGTMRLSTEVVDGVIQPLPFSGIYNPNLAYFDGGNTTISGILLKPADEDFSKVKTVTTSLVEGVTQTVETVVSKGTGDAGFFRMVDGDLVVMNLHLKDISVEGTENAGAFAGEVTGSLYLKCVLAEGASASVTAAADAAAVGGLVGLYSGSGSLTIDSSAATVYVTAGSSSASSDDAAAGGLLGKLESGTAVIYKSYVGGHTTNGKYTWVNADSTVGGNWNVVSLSGPAGGFIGYIEGGSTAKIEKSFNAATVLSGADVSGTDVDGLAGGIVGVANGSFAQFKSSRGVFDLVYVIAPVASVQEITRVYNAEEDTWSYVTAVGSAGSIIGTADNTGDEDDPISGYGLFFLPDIYADPNPYVLLDGRSNIKTIGAGKLENVYLASYLVNTNASAVSNWIIGSESAGYDLLEQETSPYDAQLKGYHEFPFAIWTRFSFGGESNIHHYYGDWEPVEIKETRRLHIHFMTSYPDDPATTEVNEWHAGLLSGNEKQEIAIQDPYRETSFMLPYVAPQTGYDTGGWIMYAGDWSDTDEWVDDKPDAESIRTFSRIDNGTSPALTYNEIRKAKELYPTGDLHITLVSTYTKQTSTLSFLQLYDMTPPDGDYDAYGSPQVLTFSDTASENTLYNLLQGKTLPMLYKTGYRFRGWGYLKDGSYIRVYKTKYDAATRSFVLVADASVSNFTVSGNVDLYAIYEAIPMRTLTVNFVDGDGNLLTSLGGRYQIKFDAEKGFSAELPLPGLDKSDQESLWPKSWAAGNSNSPGSYVTKAEIEDGEFKDPPAITFTIPAVLYENLPAADLVYNITYRGEEKIEKTGYEVLVELLETDGSLDYSTEDTYVIGYSSFDEIRDKKFLYNKTPVGYAPDIDLENEGLVAYLAGLNLTGFEFDHIEYVETKNISDTNNKQYKDKYVNTDTTVTILAVLQFARKTDQNIVFNSDGGTYIEPITDVPYGKPIYEMVTDEAHTPSNGGYHFDGWYYVEDGMTKKVDANTKMPAEKLKLTAVWTGDPVEFTVLFWLQNANDDGYTLADYKGTGFEANAGMYITPSRVEKTGQPGEYTELIRLSWHNGDSEPEYIYNLGGNITNGKKIHDRFKYFHLNWDKSKKSVKVKGDGTTLVNIYYDRNLYTLWFFLGRSQKASGNQTVSDYVQAALSEFNANEKIFYPKGDGTFDELNTYTDADGNSFYGYPAPVGATENVYGLQGGVYVPLTPVPVTTSVATPKYTYSLAAGDSGEQYGIVGTEYVRVFANTSYTYKTYTYNSSTYSPSTEYWGIRYGEYIRVYLATNGNWYRTRNNNGTLSNQYNGTVYTRTSSTSWTYNSAYTRGDNFNYYNYNQTWYFLIDGEYVQKTVRYGGTYNNMYYYYLDDSNNQVRVDYGFTATTSNYNGTERFTRVYGGTALAPSEPRFTRGASSSLYTYTYTQVATDNYAGTQYYDDTVAGSSMTGGYVPLVIESGTVVTYQPDAAPRVVRYEGPYYRYVSVPKATYYTHGRNFTYGLNGNNDTRNGRTDSEFSRTVSTTTNPFNGLYTKTATREDAAIQALPSADRLPSDQIGYFYNITARFEQNIDDQWPDWLWFADRGKDPLRYDNKTYYFISWIRQSGDNTKHIKGKFTTMSEDLITDGGRYDAVADNDATGDIPTHILENRYQNSRLLYQYDIYLRSAPGSAYNPGSPSESHEIHSSSPVSNQTEFEIFGYEFDEKTGKVSNATNGNQNTLTIIKYYYDPNPGTVTLWHGDTPLTNVRVVNANGTTETKTFPATYYYNQSLNFIDNIDKTSFQEEGKYFAGWYIADPDGYSTPIDFSKPFTMPNGDIDIYAVWKDEPNDVYLDYTGFTPPSWLAGQLDANNCYCFESVPFGYMLDTQLPEGRTWDDFEPVLSDDQEFVGWLYESNSFDPDSWEIRTEMTLVPQAADKPEPVYKDVTVRFVDADDNTKLLDPKTVQVELGKNHKFTAEHIDGYTPVQSTVYATVTDLWMTTNNGEIVFKYKAKNIEWTYTLEYYILLSTEDGLTETPVRVELEAGDGEMTVKGTEFTTLSFYTLPEGLENFRFARLELQEGENDPTVEYEPMVFAKKANDVKIRVYVTLDFETAMRFDETATYDGTAKGLVGSYMPDMPDGVPSDLQAGMRNDYKYYVASTYSADADEVIPIDAGVYLVKAAIMVDYDGETYLFWKSEDVDGRPGITLYINRREVTLTSGSVTNVFYDNAKNRTALNNGELPNGAVLRDIASDYTVSITGVSDSLLTVVRNSLDFSFSADSFRRSPSAGKDDCTTNVFSYSIKSSPAAGFKESNFDFYMVYGKLYIWKDRAAYDDYAGTT